MILSLNLTLSDKQAITATAISTNVIDLGEAGTPEGWTNPVSFDQGKGCAVPLNIQVMETFNNLTSLTVEAIVSATSAMSSPTVLLSQTVPAAGLVKGARFNINVIPTGSDQRYFALRYTVTGTAPTTGQISAAVTAGNQTAGVSY